MFPQLPKTPQYTFTCFPNSPRLPKTLLHVSQLFQIQTRFPFMLLHVSFSVTPRLERSLSHNSPTRCCARVARVGVTCLQTLPQLPQTLPYSPRFPRTLPDSLTLFHMLPDSSDLNALPVHATTGLVYSSAKMLSFALPDSPQLPPPSRLF